MIMKLGQTALEFTGQSVWITAAQLRKAGACREQVDMFTSLFGDSAVITLDLAVQHAGVFDWDWATGLLTPPARAEYDKVCAAAVAEYDKVCAPARAEYGKVCAARAEYDKVCAAAGAEYDKVRAAARAEYDKVCAPARAEYDKVCAPAWASAAIRYGLA
jgi:hypothetical protein